MSTRAYLGLGANLGDPIQQMIDARESLRRLKSTCSLRCSSFYVSSPVGCGDDQPDFVNCVLELVTEAPALELLDRMQTIESRLGRRRVIGNQNAARLIDIDLLLYGDHQINEPRLIVPHPRMINRLFVIVPLLELVDLERYQTILANGDFQGQALDKLSVN